jgi:G10 protein
MPPIRSAKNRKPPPDGYDDIEDTLLEFKNKMKDAENAPHDGKKSYEMQWPIFQIVHQRTYSAHGNRSLTLSRICIHLRALLRKGGNIKGTLQLVTQERPRRRKSDCEMEEARVRESKRVPIRYMLANMFKALLLTMYTDQRDQFQQHLYLPSTARPTERGSVNTMCQLRMSGMCLGRLSRILLVSKIPFI